MNKPENIQAFPTPIFNNNSTIPHEGMSLRDYFAAFAMNGYLSTDNQSGGMARDSVTTCAQWAYQNADAMLIERKKNQ